MIDLLAWLGITDKEIVARALPGLLSFLGVVLASALAVLAWLAKHIYVRVDKRRDLCAALYAEIKAHWLLLQVWRNEEEIASALITKFKKEKASYNPYFSELPEPPVFNAVVSEIHYLSSPEIRPVVRYFHQLAVTRTFAEDLRSEAFSNFTKERKQEMSLQMVSMLFELRAQAEVAMDVLELLARIPYTERYLELLRDWEKNGGASDSKA